MNKESWHKGKLSDMDVVRVLDSDDWIVDYDRNRGMYRVSHFEDNHFKDECWFDAYEDKEVEITESNEMSIKPEELPKFIAKFR